MIVITFLSRASTSKEVFSFKNHITDHVNNEFSQYAAILLNLTVKITRMFVT